MGRKKKHCNECIHFGKHTIIERFHDPLNSIPENRKLDFGWCFLFGDILPNDPDLLINMARGCEEYEKNQ